MRDALIGCCFASFAFLPIVRSMAGVPEFVYAVPLGLLMVILASRLSTPLLKIHRIVGVYVVVVFVFCAWILLTSLWTVSTDRALQDGILVLYLGAVAFLGAMLSSPETVRWTLIWVNLVGSVVALIVLADYVARGSFRGYDSLVSDFYLTASSILGASAVGLTAYLVSGRRTRPVLLLTLVIILTGLALGLGRMALLTTFLIATLLGIGGAINRIRTGRNWKALLSGLGIGVVVFLLAGGLFWGAMQVERTATRLMRLFGSLEYELLAGGRGLLWSAAWNQIGEKPILGHGLGSSGVLTSGSPTDYPHNLFLQVWLEGGLIGLGLLFVIVVLPLWLYSRQTDRELRRNALPFLAMYVYYLLTYQTSSNAYTARALVLMGMLVIVCLLPTNRFCSVLSASGAVAPSGLVARRR